MTSRMLVSLVTWNSAETLAACLGSLREQTCRDFSLVVLDNDSADDSPAVARGFADVVDEVVTLDRNTGYAGGHNRVLAGQECEYVLFLNPDVVLEREFIARALERLDRHPECGSLSPRLYRLRREDGQWRPTTVLDSTGIFWRPTQRHLDRGSGEEDHGQYDRAEYVFGVTGAAAVYRRTCLADLAVDGEVWDEDFFSYREDADLAWRAVWRGWKCIYDPRVTAWHVRNVLPRHRHRVAPERNMHSVRNRFLLRFKNMPLATWLRYLPWITVRDLAVLLYVPLAEPRSLRGLWQALRLWPKFRRKRRQVLTRARISRPEMEKWFQRQAVPLEPFDTAAVTGDGHRPE